VSGERYSEQMMKLIDAAWLLPATISSPGPRTILAGHPITAVLLRLLVGQVK